MRDEIVKQCLILCVQQIEKTLYVQKIKHCLTLKVSMAAIDMVSLERLLCLALSVLKGILNGILKSVLRVVLGHV